VIIASNFKTNHTRKSTKEFINSLSQFIDENSLKKNRVLVFPPASALDSFESIASNVTIGAQNAHNAIRGSYTGEIGKEQLDEFDIKTILIGHSERRNIFNESQDEISKKFDFYKSYGFEIVYCIGEPIEVKESGIEATLEYLKRQLDSIDLNYENLIIAYEPIWAIGTGKSATTTDIESIHNELKKITSRPLLYGGSVKICNTQEIIEIGSVDGLLIGTASWIVEDFSKIVYISEKTDSKEEFRC
jgi:triosephosphate isomerase